MPTDVISLIKADHREMESLFELLRKKKGDRTALLQKLTAAFTAHSRAEEERVYPQVAKARPDEKDEVHHGAEEHHEAERMLQGLHDIDISSREFDTKLEEVIEAVEHHVREEEQEVLPALAEAVSEDTLIKLGLAFAERKEQELHTVAGESTEPTRDELYRRAAEADISGRSQMTKDQLSEALRRETR